MPAEQFGAGFWKNVCAAGYAEVRPDKRFIAADIGDTACEWRLETIIYERSQIAGSGELQAAGAAAFRPDRFNGSFATEDRQRRSTVCRLAAKGIEATMET